MLKAKIPLLELWAFWDLNVVDEGGQISVILSFLSTWQNAESYFPAFRILSTWLIAKSWILAFIILWTLSISQALSELSLVKIIPHYDGNSLNCGRTMLCKSIYISGWYQTLSKFKNLTILYFLKLPKTFSNIH